MGIVTNEFVLSILAFLTVNAVVSSLRTIFSITLIVVKYTTRKEYDADTLFAAAESFNFGLVDRFKRRRRLRRFSKTGIGARGSTQALLNRYSILIIVMVALIVGAEVMVLFIMRPRKFILKSSQVDLRMHRVVNSINRSKVLPPSGTSVCDSIVDREASDSGTTIWESRACVLAANGGMESVRREEMRAIKDEDRYRFDAYIPEEEMTIKGVKMADVETFMVWMNVNTSNTMYSFTHKVQVLSFGAPTTTVFEKVPSALIRDMMIFSIKRKFGDRCTVEPGKSLASNMKLLRVACDRSVGKIDDVWLEYVRSGRELFGQGVRHPLHSTKYENGITVKEGSFDPAVKVVYGINLTSWRLLLPISLVGLAILSTSIRALAADEISPEALNDLVRRAALNECDQLPFSDLPCKTRQVLIDCGESYHLQLAVSDQVDARSDNSGYSKDLRGFV